MAVSILSGLTTSVLIRGYCSGRVRSASLRLGLQVVRHSDRPLYRSDETTTSVPRWRHQVAENDRSAPASF